MVPGVQIKIPGSFQPNAPDDMFSALGKNGQFINVVPSQNIVLIRMGENPDSAFSMEPDEFLAMIKQIRQAFAIRGEATYALTPSELASTAFRRSIFAVKDIQQDEPFTVQNVRVIRPGNGLAPKRLGTLLKSTATRNIQRGEPIRPEDVGWTI